MTYHHPGFKFRIRACAYNPAGRNPAGGVWIKPGVIHVPNDLARARAGFAQDLEAAQQARRSGDYETARHWLSFGRAARLATNPSI